MRGPIATVGRGQTSGRSEPRRGANSSAGGSSEPSFAERIEALTAAAEMVMLEALRMEAAEQRCAARRKSRGEKASRKARPHH
jgi:hypothetical protein